MDRPAPGKVEDLATLAKLDEDVLLQELKIRYDNNNIYTYVGDILIAVNPFRDLGIYDYEFSNQYCLAKKSDHPPHIFAVADSAYQCMIGHGGRTPTNQCILISGESGAGKTESTKLIIKQLVELCHGNSQLEQQILQLCAGKTESTKLIIKQLVELCHGFTAGAANITGKTESTKLLIKQLVELCHGNSQLEQQILQVNPLLEAFGNAQTNMNDNSSRFGKYIQLMFHNGHVLGAKISEYLLEKSRIVRQGPGEECFHIFYYMFAGFSKEYQQYFSLNAADKFRYLASGTKGATKDKNELKKNYESLLNALDLVGFTDEEQTDMFTMVSCVLHLGNITFEEGNDDSVYIQDMTPVAVTAKLLNIDEQELAGVLTSIVTITRGEHVKRNYSKEQADDARDAIAKILYGRLFGWIVNKVNQLLAPTEIVPRHEQREIGILDIFGFEHFEKNSFEQACINLANEQLQFFFNQHVFKQEQEEYVKEGIDWTEIKFVDNQPLLDLFLARPIGILSVLDEECSFPRATPESLVAKFNRNFGKLPYYKASQATTDRRFTISHYAGEVTYDAEGWLEKNRDTLPPGVMEMLQASKNDLVCAIFKAQMTRTGSLAFQGRKSSRGTASKRQGYRPSLEAARKRKKTQGAQFKNSLQILMERMTSSTPIFVRCLKPNHIKAPGTFDSKYIKQQLLYTGMLETTKIRREGFAVRPSFTEFVNKYKVILCRPDLLGTRENCIKILKATGIQGWQVGKTKVFLKYYHVDQIADIMEKMGKSAIVLQKVVRGFLGRRRAARKLEIARQQAEKIKGLLTQIQGLSMQMSAQQQTLLQNKVVRGFLGRRRAARKLEIARQQAEKIKGLLTQIQGLSMQMRAQQQTLLQNDKNIPDSFFGRPDSIMSMAPPPVPEFPDAGMYTPAQSVATADKRDYLEPAKKFVDFGTQPDEDSESDISDDDFVPVRSSAHPGSKMASVRWFQETQAVQIYDPDQDNFIAIWFHGVISRRQSEDLLKTKNTGTFLIRVSESRFGYTLSFKADDRVRHYMIDQLKNKKFNIKGESKVHRTLRDLIEYHRQNKISNWNGYLTDGCGQEEGECDYGDLLDERFYFKLDEQIKRMTIKNVSQNNKSGFKRQSSRPLPPPPIQSSWKPPPLPDRNYSMASMTSMAKNANRPLPKRPEEAYQRLLHNQAGLHGGRH